MAIKIIEDQEDVYLTRDELMRLREEYERGVSFMVNPPSFEAWVSQRAQAQQKGPHGE